MLAVYHLCVLHIVKSCRLCPSCCIQCVGSTAATRRSEDVGRYPNLTANFTAKMSESAMPPTSEARPIYRVMNSRGEFMDPEQDPHVSCGRC